jgi:hypothetical protein
LVVEIAMPTFAVELEFWQSLATVPEGAHMTEKPSEAYLAGYFFGRDGRRTERRFDAVGVEIKAYGEGFVDGRRTAEEWRKAIAHERSLGLHWHDRLNIQKPQVSDPGASIDPH